MLQVTQSFYVQDKSSIKKLYLYIELIEEKRALLNDILRRNVKWNGDILRRNCLLHEAIEGNMMKVKGLGRRITQLLDDLRNRRRYWELKEEADNRKKRKRQFINRT